MKEFCALLLAGGLGAGSVVTVQKVKPAISKQRATPAKPKVQKAAQRTVQTTQVTECPTISPLGPGIGELAPIQMTEQQLRPAFPGGDGGFGSGGGGGGFGPTVRPDPMPIPPGIPQPDTWVMLVAGFGFLGLALRRRKGGERPHEGTEEGADAQGI